MSLDPTAFFVLLDSTGQPIALSAETRSGPGWITLSALGGYVIVEGGSGTDTLTGVTGTVREALFGLAGSDVLRPGSGADLIFGDARGEFSARDPNAARSPLLAYDILDYSSLSDGLLIDAGAGLVSGVSAGRDVFVDIEELRGSTGRDLVSGTPGLSGNWGLRYLTMGGSDTVDLGPVNPALQAADVIRVSYAWTTAGVTLAYLGGPGLSGVTARVSYQASTITGAAYAAGSDTLVNVSEIADSPFADSLDFRDQRLNVFGEPGSVVTLTGGNDTVFGNGSTILDYSEHGWLSTTSAFSQQGLIVDLRESSRVTVDGVSVNVVDASHVDWIDPGNSAVKVSFGVDTVSRVAGVIGTDFSDTMRGSNAGETFVGNNGADWIYGGGGLDRASYQTSGYAVRVDLSGWANPLSGAWAPNDRVSPGSDYLRNIEMIRGSDYGDVLDASSFGRYWNSNRGSTSGWNALEGGGGNDTLSGNGQTRVDFDSARMPVVVDLSRGFSDALIDSDRLRGDYAASLGRDTLTLIYAVRGSDFGDSLVGGGAGWSGPGVARESFEGRAGRDTIDGGSGWDTVVYRSDPVGVTVDLGLRQATDGWGHIDTLRNVEDVWGSDFVDILSGSDRPDQESFYGGAGADLIDGRGGYDELSFAFDPAGITISLASTADAQGYRSVTDGWSGVDRFRGIEGVEGSAFNDRITGDDQANRIDGRAGNDTLDGAGGEDWIEFNDDSSGYVAAIDGSEAVRGYGVQVDLGKGVARQVDPGWVINPNNGHYYRLVNEAVTWREAFDRAQSADTHLVTVQDSGENSFLTGLIASGVDAGWENNAIWLAASDAQTEGGWRWMAGPESGQNFWSESGGTVSGAYANFNGGRPGNDNSASSGLTGTWTNLTGSGADFAYMTSSGAWFAGWSDAQAQTTASSPIAGPEGLRTAFVIERETVPWTSGDVISHFENVVGSDFRDWLVGDDGSNKFIGLGGDDTVDGGGGFDTVIYPGKRNDYWVENTWKGFIVHSQNGTVSAPEQTGNDILRNIEVVQFSDETLYVPPPPKLGVDINGSDEGGALDNTGLGPYDYYPSTWTQSGYGRDSGRNFWDAEIGLSNGISRLRISVDSAQMATPPVPVVWRLTGGPPTHPVTGELMAPNPVQVPIGTAALGQSVDYTRGYWDILTQTYSERAYVASYTSRTEGGKTFYDLEVSPKAGGVISNDEMTGVLRSIGVSFAAWSESAAISFVALSAGQSVSIGGLSFTAGANGASDWEVRSAFTNRVDGFVGTGSAQGGTLTGTLKGWSSGYSQSDGKLYFTSATPNADVTDLVTSGLAPGQVVKSQGVSLPSVPFDFSFDTTVSITDSVGAATPVWTGASADQAGALRFDVSNLPPLAYEARHHGSMIEILFSGGRGSISQGLNFPADVASVISDNWDVWSGHPDSALFNVMVNGTRVDVGLALSERAIYLLLPQAIPAGASVIVGYTDPVGDQIQHVVQDSRGMDSPSFSLTSRELPGYGLSVRVLDGAELGWDSEQETNRYVGDSNWDAAHATMKVVRINGANAYQLDFAPPWTVNPAFDGKAASGYASYRYAREHYLLDVLAVDPSVAALQAGSEVYLRDVFKVDSPFRIARWLFQPQVTQDPQASTAPRQFDVVEWTAEVPIKPSELISSYFGFAWDDNVFRGSAQSDYGRAFLGDDTLYGFEGNDTLSGGPGNDLLDGGPGLDAAVFQGNRDQFEWARSSSGVTTVIQKFSGGGLVNAQGQINLGIDRLVSIELLNFDDGVVAIEPGYDYKEIIGRVIDGYVSGALVFADLDGDGERDWFDRDGDGAFDEGEGEAWALSDAQGAYRLYTAADLSSVKLVAQGGIDITTRATIALLTAPPGVLNLTPVSTLVAVADDRQSGAGDSILGALGLTRADLNYDPVATLLNGGPKAAQAATVIQAGAALLSLVNGVAAVSARLEAGLDLTAAISTASARSAIGEVFDQIVVGANLSGLLSADVAQSRQAISVLLADALDARALASAKLIEASAQAIANVTASLMALSDADIVAGKVAALARLGQATLSDQLSDAALSPTDTSALSVLSNAYTGGNIDSLATAVSASINLSDLFEIRVGSVTSDAILLEVWVDPDRSFDSLDFTLSLRDPQRFGFDAAQAVSVPLGWTGELNVEPADPAALLAAYMAGTVANGSGTVSAAIADPPDLIRFASIRVDRHSAAESLDLSASQVFFGGGEPVAGTVQFSFPLQAAKLSVAAEAALLLEPGAGESTAMRFELVLDRPMLSAESLNWTLVRVGSTESAQPDIVGPASGTLHFASGQTRALLSLTLADDMLVEGDEQFRLLLSQGSSGLLLPDAAGTPVVTVHDTDVGMALQGKVYHWKQHALMSEVSAKVAGPQPVSDGVSNLFELRTLEPGQGGGLTAELWANFGSAQVHNFGFKLACGTGVTGSFTPDAAALGGFVAFSGDLSFSAMAQTASLSGSVRVGTLQIGLPAGQSAAQLAFVSGEADSRSLKPYTVSVFAAADSTGADGVFGLAGLDDGRYALDLDKIVAASGGGASAVNSADALAALKLAVGRNPNPDGLAVSPYQFIAADVSGDGRVTSADAMSILKMAVGRSDAPVQEWLFVREDQDFWDQTTQRFTTTRSSVQWDRESVEVVLPSDSNVNLVAVLKGDVDGSWAPPANSARVSDAYYYELIRANPGLMSAAQFGLHDAVFGSVPD